MKNVPIKICTDPEFPTEWIPKYETEGSAGMDLRAFIDEPIVINPGEIARVRTGVSIELPEGYEGQVRSRSGLSSKHGIIVINAPGTIDSDYRGEIGAPLINLGRDPFVIYPGDRVAQLVISEYTKVSLNLADSLSETSRGKNGFGHSGTK